VQFCRAYLPPGYRSDGEAPLIVQLHGFNPANPEYVRWWSIDNRHHPIQEIDRGADSPIYLEPHGRGNTQYQGFGEKDVLRAIAEAKKLFAVDDDRVYLTGDSMGGWGVWQVATRNPEVFAAVAPVFGGADYRAQFDEAFLGKLNAPERFLWERRSSFAQAEALSNLPVLVSHGDADRAVNVEYSRSALRMLQRWGYDVRYHELPGRGHEDMKVAPGIWDWFLRHRRVAEPLRVRVRAADLQSAAAYWVRLVRAERPMEFLVADAEVVGPNRIRLDTRNVAAAELRPGSLVDPSRAVEVVWNGVSRSVAPKAGRLDLRTGAPPRALEKTPQVAGPFADLTNTPFAVVAGTIARDPAMRRMCALKAQAFVNNWRNWQKVTPRVFEDVRLTDADAARYSLLLIGGPEDNAVARRLAARLPLIVRPNEIAIDGKAFPVQDGGVALVYPSPLNPDRYVAVVAGTSPGALWFADPMDRQAADWDFVITDGRGASAAALVGPGPFPERGRVVSGYFDSAWKVDEALLVWGDAEARAKASVMAAPRPVTLPPLALDRVAGTYAIPQGPRIRVFREGRRLLGGQEGQVPGELVPESETSFFLAEPYMRIVFEKDAAGKAVAFQLKRPGREARAPRVE
jgi:dienelactone hydrolase